MKKLLLILLFLLLPALAHAQCNGVFPAKTICGNNSASPGIPSQVPQSVLTGIPGGTPGQIEFNNAGVFGGFTASGDCTITTSTGLVICTKTNGTAFGAFATFIPSSNSQAGNYTLLTTDCYKTVAVTGGMFTVTVPAATSFADNCPITVYNGDTTRGKILTGAGLPANINYILPPLTAFQITKVGGVWASTSNQTQWLLPGATPEVNTYVWHIDGTSGSDTAADGLATGAGAFRTCQHAMDWVSQYVNANQQNIVLQVDDATQCTSLSLKAVVGIYDFWPNSNLVFQGAGLGTTMSCGANICITGLAVKGWIITNLTLSSSVTWINADAGATIYLGRLVFTGGATTGVACIYGSMCEQINTIDINGTSLQSYAVVQFSGSRYVNAGANIINMNTVINYVAFWNISDAATAIVNNMTYSGIGSATGTAFAAVRGASMITGGKCATTGGGTNMPGSIAGSFTTGYCN